MKKHNQSYSGYMGEPNETDKFEIKWRRSEATTQNIQWMRIQIINLEWL